MALPIEKSSKAQHYTFAMIFKSAFTSLMLTLAGSSLALPALAQWQWIDKDGHKVFSDRAPPADVAEKNILKQPGAKLGAAHAAATPAASADAGTGVAAATTPALKASAPEKPSSPKLTGKDAQLEARKKQADEEAATKQKQEDEKLAKAKAENCARAQKGLITMQSGVRISVTNAQGEREFMDDKAKAVEVKRLQGITDSDCKK
ncbi:MAG: DUF4124 domain-containing protein [Polaromonas sp.]